MSIVRRQTSVSPLGTKIERIGRIAADLNRWVIWPKVDLGVRLYLAQALFRSGAVKLASWQTALELAASEYPIHGLSPAGSAALGITVELTGAACLALGLMTRYSALSLLALACLIQATYRVLDANLFLAALYGWFAVAGAGSVSLDALLRRGLGDSALPLIPRIVRASERLRLHGISVYLVVLRVWLGVAVLMAGLHLESATLAVVFPAATASVLPAGAAVLVGALLCAGLATRAVSLALLLLADAYAMSVGHRVDAMLVSLVLLLPIFRGGGALSIDTALWAWLQGRFLQPRDLRRAPGDLPRIVIVGAGFAGVACARALRYAQADVTLVDRTNYHLFQPLLYQVATGALSPSDIAAPIRPLFRDAPSVRLRLGTVHAIDPARGTVELAEGQLAYDYLVLATGAKHSYFGKDGWRSVAPGLKGLEDAIEIRRKILTAFEKAEATDDPQARAAWLTFLIVGGGPTGVELAGAIAELARFGMNKEFRNFDPADARVILAQSAPRLLPAFAEDLATIAQRSLERLGVDVRLNTRVESIDEHGVMIAGRHISVYVVLWAAGVEASPAARWLGCAADHQGRVCVGPDLSVPGYPRTYAVGDTAASTAWAGKAVPGLAPAAKQAGAYVARQIIRDLSGAASLPPFEYRHRGSLATIGRKAAVADFGRIKLWGAPAWWLWGLVHVGFLVGLRNRISTTVNWLWAYLTYAGAIRLITSDGQQAISASDTAPRSALRRPDAA